MGDFPIPLPIFIGSAVVDSINPCAFGVLIFLLSYLLEHGQGNKFKMLTHGAAYISAVFITYLVAGIVLMPIIGSLGKISLLVYGVLGVVVIISGLIEIKDFFWYGKGFSLQLLPGSSERIKMYVNKISDNLLSAFLLGAFVALVELPCTGAVYLAVLSVMALSGVSILNIEYLLFYNFIFVLPLILIVVLFVMGVSAETFEKFRKAHRGFMRLAIGLVLVALGIWMLLAALPFDLGIKLPGIAG